MSSIVSSCFLIASLVSAYQDQQEMNVRPQQDVSLRCRAPTDASIILLEWSRPDLKSDGYVFFYRNKRSYENYQHPSFRGRVTLSDPEIKGGDASVVLKSVTANDTGTYECRIIVTTKGAQSEVRQVIELTVTGDTAGQVRGDGNICQLLVGLLFLSLLNVLT